MHDATLKTLSDALAARTLSSVEATALFLKRINALNPRYNCFVSIDENLSLAQAKEADRARAAGRAQALTGVPIAQKDIFCAKGWLTTCGSKMLANFVSPYDAHVVQRLNEAGAVILGKTNMDEFAMGSSNETSHYGPVRNPWNPETVPGGSSGGSAAAVAARLAPAATGTDTGGSIRQPAALTGVCGLKPTYGVVSRYGMIAFASSLDQAGPMAKSAEDLALMLNAMAGFDVRDSTSLDRPAEDYGRELSKDVAGLRIGLPREFFSEGAAPDVVTAVEAAIAQYQALGCEVVEVGLPNMRLSVPVYYVLAPAEASSNLARYDGVRYGYRTPRLPRPRRDVRENARGRLRRGSEAPHPDRHLRAFARLLRRLLHPRAEAAPRDRAGLHARLRAVRRDHGADEPDDGFPPRRKSRGSRCRCICPTSTRSRSTSPGCPGCRSRAASTRRGCRSACQIIGNYFREAQMLNVAHQYQLATDWHLRAPPGIADA